MKKAVIAIIIIAALGYLVWQFLRPVPLTPQQVSQLNVANNAGQLILVGATGGSDALFSLYEKKDKLWQEVFTVKAYIGKNGLGKEREGDSRSPVGIFHFTKAFGIAPDPGCKMPYTQVDDTHYWVGDGASPLYNQFTSTKDGAVFDTKESEHIIEYTKPYQYCLNISYNEEGKPGLGSAIFLHCYSNNTYTGGCVAIPEDNMRQLMRRIQPGCKIIIAELKKLGNY